MSRSVVRIYLHLVWATKYRRPSLSTEHEQLILKSFADTCEGLGVRLIAANGAWDHVHLLIAWRGDVCVDDTVRELKTRAAKVCREHALADPYSPPAPRWQRGYAALSLDDERVGVVRRYIQRQKQHHRRPDTLIERLERCAEDEERDA